MRLTYNNIRHVRAHTKNGIAYAFVVSLRSNYISDMREYAKYDERGRISGDEEYPLNELPATVSKFIFTHRPILEQANEEFAVYVFR